MAVQLVLSMTYETCKYGTIFLFFFVSSPMPYIISRIFFFLLYAQVYFSHVHHFYLLCSIYFHAYFDFFLCFSILLCLFLYFSSMAFSFLFLWFLLLVLLNKGFFFRFPVSTMNIFQMSSAWMFNKAWEQQCKLKKKENKKKKSKVTRTSYLTSHMTQLLNIELGDPSLFIKKKGRFKGCFYCNFYSMNWYILDITSSFSQSKFIV